MRSQPLVCDDGHNDALVATGGSVGMTEYAHFVGRIGGLAAALGVGIALTAATPAVVYADTGNASSPTNNSTSTSSPSGTSGTNTPAGTTSATTATPRHIGSSATPTPGTAATPSGATELPSSNTTTASAPSGTHTPADPARHRDPRHQQPPVT